MFLYSSHEITGECCAGGGRSSRAGGHQKAADGARTAPCRVSTLVLSGGSSRIGGTRACCDCDGGGDGVGAPRCRRPALARARRHRAAAARVLCACLGRAMGGYVSNLSIKLTKTHLLKNVKKY